MGMSSGSGGLLRGVQGAIGFLTWLPVGRSEAHWKSFAAHPWVIPIVGYVVGVIAVVPFLLPLPGPLVGALYLLAIYLATGINHVDGLLDLADGLATHGDAERALAAMQDSAVGVAGVLSLGIVLVGLFAMGQTLAGLPRAAVGLVLAAEVGAKLGMVAVIALGTATHEGLGEALSSVAGRGTLLAASILALPAVLVTWPRPAAIATLVMGASVGLAIVWWTQRRLGGISGDVMGATNELARLAGLGAGVILWTL